MKWYWWASIGLVLSVGVYFGIRMFNKAHKNKDNGNGAGNGSGNGTITSETTEINDDLTVVDEGSVTEPSGDGNGNGGDEPVGETVARLFSVN